jgi:hypothetical protein
MPLSLGRVSPCCCFAGSSGANRRGRGGCAVELIGRVAAKIERLAMNSEGEKVKARASVHVGRMSMPVIVVHVRWGFSANDVHGFERPP